MTKPILAAVALALLVLAARPAAGQAEDADGQLAERQAVYDEFRHEFESGHYEAALPHALRLVDLFESQAPMSEQLPTAYNNLGAVQWRTGDLTGAEKSFSRALELLEQTQGIASRRLIAPLAGLATVYAAQGQHARAADALQRAIAVSRRAEGLFNLQQLDLLEPLVQAFEAMDALDGVERELRYVLQVVRKRFGPDDPRTLPAVTRLAVLYEKMQRYPSARALWVEAARIGAREGGGRNAATIKGLLGIARTHRLQYVEQPDSLVESVPIDPLTGKPDPLMSMSMGTRGGPVKLDDDGERAALQALEILDGTPDPPNDLLGATLLEVGDWYTTAREPTLALPYYERAWPVLKETLGPGGIHPLAVPRPLYYRVPPAATRQRLGPDLRTVARRMEFSLDIAADGEVTSARVLSSEADESQTAQARRALERAWFSPRFEDGRAVPTEGFLFVEYWHDVAPPEPEPAAEPAGDPDATEPAEPPAPEVKPGP
jgi:tetratricopeptide (TPR) repeat protein